RVRLAVQVPRPAPAPGLLAQDEAHGPARGWLARLAQGKDPPDRRVDRRPDPPARLLGAADAGEQLRGPTAERALGERNEFDVGCLGEPGLVRPEVVERVAGVRARGAQAQRGPGR